MKPLSELIQEVQQLLEAIARHPNTTTANNVRKLHEWYCSIYAAKDLQILNFLMD